MTYLVLRFSSLGNVAMMVPVVASVAARYPEHHFVVVAEKPLEAMYYGIPNVSYHEAKLAKHGCVIGSVYRLYKALVQYRADAVIDLQDDHRSRLLRMCFRLHAVPATVIQYGRMAKRRLVALGAEHAQPLPSEFERYAATFAKAGLPATLHFTGLANDSSADQKVEEVYGAKDRPWIGVAPFAKHQTNRLPYRLMKQVIEQLSEKAQVFLFGAGEIECEMLYQWASLFPRVHSVAGRLTLADELALMRRLDCMLCMDSANQHLAALVGTPALSVWCGTHPYMGFASWQQLPERILQKDLPCRPCTVHGTKDCRFKNYLCQKWEVEQILTPLWSMVEHSDQ